MPEWDDDWKGMTLAQRTCAVIEELWEYVESEFATGTDWPRPGTPLQRLAMRSDEVETELKGRFDAASS